MTQVIAIDWSGRAKGSAEAIWLARVVDRRLVELENGLGRRRRSRLSADGKLFTCLFAINGHDLRAPPRDGASDAEISAAICAIWRLRNDRYSELRTAEMAALPKVEISYIGG